MPDLSRLEILLARGVSDLSGLHPVYDLFNRNSGIIKNRLGRAGAPNQEDRYKSA